MENDNKEGRRISSSLGSMNLGNIPKRRELTVEDERDLYDNAVNPYAKKGMQTPQITDNSQAHNVQEPFQSRIPEHLRSNPNISFESDFDFDDRIDARRPEERQMIADRKQAAVMNQRAPIAAVNRFEILVGIGRYVTNFDIGEYSFELRSLKTKELKHVMNLVAKESTDFNVAMMLRNSTLAYSLAKINDYTFESLFGTDEFEKRLEFVENMDHSVLQKLWNEYQLMKSEHEKNLGLDLGSNPKEVAETIKK